MPALPTAYTDRNVLDAAEKAALLATLAAKGIRLLPYPFDSAVAVVSDIDVSCKAAFESYVGTLVRRLGLDFGDSIWLTRNIEDGDVARAGQGFLNADYSGGPEHHDEDMVQLLTLAEAVAQYHTGNIDHFHAFLQAGPRVLWPAPIECAGCLTRARLSGIGEDPGYSWASLGAFGVSLIGAFDASFPPPDVRIIAKDGREDRGFVEAGRQDIDGRQRIDFANLQPAAAGRPHAIALDDIAEVAITFASPNAAAALDRVLIATAPRAILLDRIDWLRTSQGVAMTLITEHAGLFFRTRVRSDRFDAAMGEKIRETGSAGPYNGRHVEGEEAIFSTDADDPDSVSRVLPELADEHGLRFIVPAAATSATGWPVVDLVTPTPTRAGRDLYWARRTMPNIQTPEGKRKFDGTKSRQSTFTRRIGTALAGTDAEPGLCWPIYTHLGCTETGQLVMPDPYFDETELLALQDRVFGITPSGARGQRIWFTRASTLYDYALAIRSIGDHVARPDANTVAITSWHDTTLDRRMPTCAAQLYGLTFAVDDAAAAVVTLDGVPIETLYRNRATVAGGASVTIAEGRRWPVIGAIDPVVAIRDAGVAGDWTWDDASRGGRLSAGAEELASLRLPLDGRQAEGAQALSVDVRRDAGALFGITVETAGGAHFFFGDRPVAVRIGVDFAAQALVHPRMRRDGARQRHVFAFHDLAWAADAQAGGPLPNHPLAAVTLWTLAREGRGAAIADVGFLRPHTRREGDDFCLAGLAAGAPGSTVEAEALLGGMRATTLVDAHGHFCFGVLPPGGYRVRNVDAGEAWVDTTRAIVDLSAPVVDLRLTRV